MPSLDTPVVTTRRVGTCAHCRGAVLLRIRPHRLGADREARCACGATVIPTGFFNGLGKRFVTAVRR